LYLNGHPFSSFSSYDPDPVNPSLQANAYSLALGKFIDSKCNGCKEIIMLGDDYVIPHYRVDYADIAWWNWFRTWFETNEDTNYIFTDQPYVKETKKTMGDIEKLFDEDEFEEIIFVIPDEVSSSLNSEINTLKSTIQSVYGYDSGDIEVYHSAEVDCDSYRKLDGGTLILVGGREDNNAIQCLPWFDVGSLPSDNFKASLALERNVWGSNAYSLVVSGDDLAAGVKNLNEIIEYPELLSGSLSMVDTLYLHELSDLDEHISDWEYVKGYALGTCDVGGTSDVVTCSATDLVVSVLPVTDVITDIRDMSWFCISYGKNKITGAEESFDGLLCGVSSAGGGMTILKYTGIGTVAGVGGDIFTTAVKRVLKTARHVFENSLGSFMRYTKQLDLFSKSGFTTFVGDRGLREGGAEFAQILSKNGKALDEVFAEFDPEVLSPLLRNLDDFDDIAVGAKGLMRLGAKLDNIPYNQVDKAKFLEMYGELAKKFDIPEQGLRRIEFTELPDVAGSFLLGPKKIQLPSNRVADMATVAHELAHANTIHKLIVKIRHVDSEFAEVLLRDFDSVPVDKWRGFFELIADKNAHDVAGVPLRKFFDDFEEADFLLFSATDIGDIILSAKTKPGVGTKGAAHYIAYMHALAQKTGDTDIKRAIEVFLDTSDEFGVAKTELINLADDMANEIDILSKSPDHVFETLNDFERQIDNIEDMII
jgi:hypothetical protein